jgi:hypothetical protein
VPEGLDRDPRLELDAFDAQLRGTARVSNGFVRVAGQRDDGGEARRGFADEVGDPVLVDRVAERERLRVVLERAVHGQHAVQHLAAQAVHGLVAEPKLDVGGVEPAVLDVVEAGGDHAVEVLALAAGLALRAAHPRLARVGPLSTRRRLDQRGHAVPQARRGG